jgi:hypothetical protein
MCSYDDSLMIAPPPTCPTNKICSISSSIQTVNQGRGRREMQVEGGDVSSPSSISDKTEEAREKKRKTSERERERERSIPEALLG